MILAKPEILDYLESGKLQIEPSVSQEDIEQVSIDLHIGHQFTLFKEKPAYISDVRLDASIFGSADLWDRYTDCAEFVLEPGRLVLAQTLEKVTMPNDLAGLIEGRSSYARMGVTIHITAPKIDPGFKGQITLEMANFGGLPIRFRCGVDKPAQLILFQITSPLPDTEVYGSKKTHHFQDQTTPIPATILKKS